MAPSRVHRRIIRLITCGRLKTRRSSLLFSRRSLRACRRLSSSPRHPGRLGLHFTAVLPLSLRRVLTLSALSWGRPSLEASPSRSTSTRCHDLQTRWPPLASPLEMRTSPLMCSMASMMTMTISLRTSMGARRLSSLGNCMRGSLVANSASKRVDLLRVLHLLTPQPVANRRSRRSLPSRWLHLSPHGAPRHPSQADHGRWLAAPVVALSRHANCVGLSAT